MKLKHLLNKFRIYPDESFEEALSKITIIKSKMMSSLLIESPALLVCVTSFYLSHQIVLKRLPETFYQSHVG
jgi:hypothetical protein